MNILIIEVVPLDLQVCAGTESSSAFKAMYFVMIRECSDSVVLGKGYVCFESFSPVPPKSFTVKNT